MITRCWVCDNTLHSSGSICAVKDNLEKIASNHTMTYCSIMQRHCNSFISWVAVVCIALPAMFQYRSRSQFPPHMQFDKIWKARWGLESLCSLWYTGGPLSLQQWVNPDSEQRQVTHLAGAAGSTHWRGSSLLPIYSGYFQGRGVCTMLLDPGRVGFRDYASPDLLSMCRLQFFRSF